MEQWKIQIVALTEIVQCLHPQSVKKDEFNDASNFENPFGFSKRESPIEGYEDK